MTAHSGPSVARRVVIHGHVQGVFFRDSLRRVGARHGVSGWAGNRPDGTVEAVLEGPPEGVEAAVAFCREGPRGAHVEHIDVQELAPHGLAGFQVR